VQAADLQRQAGKRARLSMQDIFRLLTYQHKREGSACKQRKSIGISVLYDTTMFYAPGSLLMASRPRRNVVALEGPGAGIDGKGVKRHSPVGRSLLVLV